MVAKSTKQPNKKRKPRKPAVLSDHPLQLIRPGRLARLLDVNSVTIWRWQRDGVLPPPTQIGAYVKGWTYQQVEHLLKSTVRGGQDA
jgi:predicted DNA-binding transcriptional regulator AlpA